MDYNKKLQRYLTAITNNMQSSYEWYVNECKCNKREDVSYLTAISCIESYRDDMQGAIGFAHFADLITPEQFNEAWDLAQSVHSAYSAKVWDLFFKKEDE